MGLIWRDLQEEHICIFGALHDTQSGRVDIERSRADVGLDKLLQMRHWSYTIGL